MKKKSNIEKFVEMQIDSIKYEECFDKIYTYLNKYKDIPLFKKCICNNENKSNFIEIVPTMWENV